MVRLLFFSGFLLFTAACGKTQFSGAGGTASSKSSDSQATAAGAIEPSAPAAQQDQEEHLLQEAEENPEVVKNYSCGKKKVYICHVPAGHPENAQTLCVSECAIAAHLSHQAHGGEKDMLGSCDEAPNKRRCQR